MADWIAPLYQELDAWQAVPAPASFWWRDDDAQSASLALDGLLELAQTHDIPLALAVIPSGLETSLVARIHPVKRVRVLQHGFSHQNYAPPTEKKMELGMHRLEKTVLHELSTGFAILQQTFGAQFVKILVPPWNRIATPLRTKAQQVGLRGISTFGARCPHSPPSLPVVNTHVDIINWKKNKTFVGATQVVRGMVEHLAARRVGTVDRNEPTGLLTHHLVHDAECDEFLAQLFAALTAHASVEWLDAATFIAHETEELANN